MRYYFCLGTKGNNMDIQYGCLVRSKRDPDYNCVVTKIDENWIHYKVYKWSPAMENPYSSYAKKEDVELVLNRGDLRKTVGETAFIMLTEEGYNRVSWQDFQKSEPALFRVVVSILTNGTPYYGR